MDRHDRGRHRFLCIRFPILTTYLRLVAEGARILPYRADACCWIDVGRPEDLARAQTLGLA